MFFGGKRARSSSPSRARRDAWLTRTKASVKPLANSSILVSVASSTWFSGERATGAETEAILHASRNRRDQRVPIVPDAGLVFVRQRHQIAEQQVLKRGVVAEGRLGVVYRAQSFPVLGLQREREIDRLAPDSAVGYLAGYRQFVAALESRAQQDKHVANVAAGNAAKALQHVVFKHLLRRRSGFSNAAVDDAATRPEALQAVLAVTLRNRNQRQQQSFAAISCLQAKMRVAKRQFDGDGIQDVAIQGTQDSRSVQVYVSLIGESLLVDNLLRNAIELVHDHQDVLAASVLLQPFTSLGEDYPVNQIVDRGQVPLNQPPQSGTRPRHILQYQAKLDDARRHFDALEFHLAVQQILDLADELLELRAPEPEAGVIQVVHKLADHMKDDVRRLHVLQVQPLFDFQQRDKHRPSSLAIFQHVLDALQLGRLPNAAMAREHSANGYFRPGDTPCQQLLDIVRRERLLLLPIYVQVGFFNLQGPSRIELAVKRAQNIHRFDCSPCGGTALAPWGAPAPPRHHRAAGRRRHPRRGGRPQRKGQPEDPRSAVAEDPLHAGRRGPRSAERSGRHASSEARRSGG